MRKSYFTWLLTVILMLLNDNAAAYWENVHESIANEVIEQNLQKVDSWVKIYTGLRGVDETINGRTLRKWIKEGSIKEDEHVSQAVVTRYINHFYDPLSGLGLVDPPYFGTSSYLWASNERNNAWRWEMARTYFHDGLTKTIKSEREESLSKAFRAIGQVMHLVQDLAVPAHVRNDEHNFTT